MRVGIVGLGLIGGSLAKAYSRAGGHEVLACELDAKVLAIAHVEGAVQGELTADNMSGCDLILIAISPAAAIRWLREAARKRSEKSMGQRLAAEMLEAAENRGGAVKKRDEVHRMADANKAFAHFRF